MIVNGMEHGIILFERAHPSASVKLGCLYSERGLIWIHDS
jgi:hypothetical protein